MSQAMARRAALPVLAALLVAAAAATGAAGGAPAAPSPGAVYEALSEAAAVLALVIGLATLAVMAWALWPPPLLKKGRPPAKRSLRAILPLVFIYLLIAALFRRHLGPLAGSAARAQFGRPGDISGGAAHPPAADWAGLAVAGLVMAAGVVFLTLRALRRPPPRPPQSEEAPLLPPLSPERLDLGAIEDPRAAVIAAYAAMERHFARRGVPRRPQEAASEYLLRLPPGSAQSALTDLYQVARFSTHDMPVSVRAQAVAAYEGLS